LWSSPARVLDHLRAYLSDELISTSKKKKKSELTEEQKRLLEEIKERNDFALKSVVMERYKNKSPERLSGGQKQRIAIAGVLALKPEILVLDESTAMLDPRGRRDVMDAIEKLNREENITILHITHYMDEAARADRVIVINDGEIYMDGTPREVFSQVDALRAAGLEVPQGTELLHALRSDGYDLPLDLIRPEECMECLVRLIRGEKAGGTSV
jgi:energy-coupling factor transport system ATP-binding protein